MKKYLYILMLPIALLWTACDKEGLSVPVASFTMSATETSINETVTFTYTGTGAEQVVLFTGDEGHNHDLIHQGNSGLVLNKGLLTYSYKTAGVYKVVLIATNYNDRAEDMVYSVDSAWITVNDDNVELRSVSLRKDMYLKELQAQKIGDNTLLFAVPYKVRVSNRDIAVSMNKQRVSIEPMSNSAVVMVNGAAYNENTSYDLTQPFEIEVCSPSGNSKTYHSVVMHYPVFESFSIEGVDGVSACSEYYFDKVSITVELPAGTDVSALKPVFASADAQQITVNGEQQISGETVVDFTEPVVYTLTTGDGDVSVESTVEVSVSLL